jgi:hypothetical protein
MTPKYEWLNRMLFVRHSGFGLLSSFLLRRWSLSYRSLCISGRVESNKSLTLRRGNSSLRQQDFMADETPNPPGPPKPPEPAKVQPKKETVRISLPPKPTATIRLPSLPAAGPATGAAAPAAPAPPSTASAPAPPPRPAPSAPPASAPRPAPAAPASRPGPAAPASAPRAGAAPPPPSAPKSKAPAPVTAGSAATVSALDKGLAIAALVISIGAVVSIYLLKQMGN